MPFGEAKVKGERWGGRKLAPGFHGVRCTWTIHQKTGFLESSAAGEIDDGRIHAPGQAEVISMEQWWLALLVLTGLGTEEAARL